jgi:O-antigen ligase
VTQSIRQQPDPLLRASFSFLLIILFCVFSAALEMLPVIRNLRIILILATLGLLAIFATGQFVKVLSVPIGQAVVAFTVWFIACIPFGSWPGGSFTVFTDRWFKAALMFLLTAGLLTTLPQARRLFLAIAYAIGLMSIITLVLNGRQAGRLMLDNTRYANANDLAWTLLVGLTFLGYLYIRGSRWQKAAAVILSLPMLLALSRTGSREGSLGVIMLGVVVFIRASKGTRIKMVAGLPIILVLLLAVLPSQLRERYTTWFGDSQMSEFGSSRFSTLGSTEARMTLLKDSLRLTAMHPLLGVGPGNFPVAQDVLAQARGEKSAWHVTHNTYTEVSSEMGLPGFAIYLVFLYQTYKVLKSIIRTKSPSPEWAELRILALTVQTALFVFLVIALFSSLEFNSDVPILAGLTVALGFMAQKQRAIDRAASAPIVADEPLLEPGFEPVAVGRY